MATLNTIRAILNDAQTQEQASVIQNEVMTMRNDNEPELHPTLSDQPPDQIPVEAAIAVLAPLKKQGLKAASLLAKKGLSRAELAELLGISEKSVNGVIGSINRRYSFRFDKTKYDRKKCRVIYFNRKTARYEYMNGELEQTFEYALDALNQVAKDGLSYEQYNYENVFFKTRYLESLESKNPRFIRLNPSAIDEFMGENGTVHDFEEDLEYDDGSLHGYEYFRGKVLVGQETCNTHWEDHDGQTEWFECWLGDDGNIHAMRNEGKSIKTTEDDESEEDD